MRSRPSPPYVATSLVHLFFFFFVLAAAGDAAPGAGFVGPGARLVLLQQRIELVSRRSGDGGARHALPSRRQGGRGGARGRRRDPWRARA